MVYGADKARQMARSLLPSTWGGAHRAKARIQRAGRRQAKQEVAQLVRDAEAAEELDLYEVEGEVARELRFVVGDRRGADKVNPFIRWATAVTRHLPREDRLSHVRGCVPRGVIGEHALEHIKDTPAFEDPRERAWRRRSWGPKRPPKWLDRGEYAELLRGVLRAGGHERFNRWMQARHIAHYELRTERRRDPCRPGHFVERTERVHTGSIRARLLLGLHDVLPFLDEVGQWRREYGGARVYRPNGSNPEWFTAMDHFLRTFKANRGHLQATMAALGVGW
jgi:hypothetical protein